jgi:hypothetical protein
MVRCREIRVDDVNRVIDLLTHGFPRKRDYWLKALKRLSDHPTPPELPKYGYVLEHEGELVGVVLLISTSILMNGSSYVRCNVSSWYVEPAYRIYASILAKHATRHKNVTFFNVSPARHTWPILKSQGFECFASGRTIVVPAFSQSPSGVHVRAVTSEVQPGPDLELYEIDMLQHHKSYGCLSIICEASGRRHPFIFGLNLKYGLVPVAHLIYCRSISEFVRLAAPIGRYLICRGYAFVVFESNGPTPNIVGQHSDGQPKYRKGGDQIRPGDVAYSERVMFGY